MRFGILLVVAFLAVDQVKAMHHMKHAHMEKCVYENNDAHFECREFFKPDPAEMNADMAVCWKKKGLEGPAPLIQKPMMSLDPAGADSMDSPMPMPKGGMMHMMKKFLMEVEERDPEGISMKCAVWTKIMKFTEEYSQPETQMLSMMNCTENVNFFNKCEKMQMLTCIKNKCVEFLME